jgi:hypothetical protein
MGTVPLFKDGKCIYGDAKRVVSLDRLARMTGDFSDEALYKSAKAFMSDKSSTVSNSQKS